MNLPPFPSVDFHVPWKSEPDPIPRDGDPVAGTVRPFPDTAENPRFTPNRPLSSRAQYLAA